MCPSTPTRHTQRQVFTGNAFSWFSVVLLVMAMAALPQKSPAQESNTEAEIRTIDMRGQNPVSASVVAIKNSRNHVVVVLIRGGSQELIDETKGQLKALVHRGYDRLGVVLCDLKPGEIGPVLGIVSDGTAYAAIKGAEPDSKTMWQLYSLVRDAYQNNVLPHLEHGQNEKN